MIYFFPFLLMGAGLAGIQAGAGWSWSGFLILFVFFPVLEFFLKDLKLYPEKHVGRLHDFALLLTPFFLTAILILGLWSFLSADSFLEKLGLILSAGSMLGAFGITAAHELVHRREKPMRAVGVYNLMLVNFAHWGLEHVFGHHKFVATHYDPATARKGESLYRFWLREYFGVLKGAFKVDAGKVMAYWGFTALISLGIYFYAGAGAGAVIFWWACSLVAVLLLQTVDYIEHYGLQRPRNENGDYSAFKLMHSWDTSSLFTNAALFNLGFHSHHHLKASLSFENLREQPQAQQMPYGYSFMVLAAFVPPLFISMMDPRLPAK